MPRGSAYPGPADALARYRAVVDASENGEVKGAKNPYTSRNGHMFSFLDAQGTMALRLSPEMEAEFRMSYDSGPVVQYGRTMRGYSSVPSENTIPYTMTPPLTGCRLYPGTPASRTPR